MPVPQGLDGPRREINSCGAPCFGARFPGDVGAVRAYQNLGTPSRKKARNNPPRRRDRVCGSTQSRDNDCDQGVPEVRMQTEWAAMPRTGLSPSREKRLHFAASCVALTPPSRISTSGAGLGGCAETNASKTNASKTNASGIEDQERFPCQGGKPREFMER
jgi:hypothetical protein